MLIRQDDLLGALINDVAHLLRLEIDRRASAYNLTRTKWLAISLLRNGPGITQSELAQHMELGAAATGRLVDRLVERGFVERRSDKTDRRANPLYLTSLARATLQDLEGEADALRRDVFAGLSEDEIVQLQKTLQHLKGGLQAIGAKHG